MTKPAAKEGDQVVGIDTHVVLVPSPGGPVPTPTPMPFDGVLCDKLAGRVRIENAKAATAGSVARNVPPHLPAGGPFLRVPANEATILQGSRRVLVENKQAARRGDPALSCSDPVDAPNGTVVASGKVLVGG